MDEKSIYELFEKRYVVLEQDEYNWRMKNAELVVRKKTAREIIQTMFEEIKGYENIDIILHKIAQRYGVEVDE